MPLSAALPHHIDSQKNIQHNARMKHLAALVTGPLLLTFTTISSPATTVSFGGEIYDAVDWLSADIGNNTADGIASSNTVDFSTGAFAEFPPVITVRSSGYYASDSSFDALSYGTGDIESLDMFAISLGGTSITLANSVASLLLFIGDDGNHTPGLNAGQWEFAPEWALSILDTNQNTNHLNVVGGNVLKNQGGGGSGATGVVRLARVDGNPFNTVSFSNPGGGGGGGDGDGISLGIAVTQVPEPTTLLLSLAGLGTLMTRRRRGQPTR
jgi:hypothetical protein